MAAACRPRTDDFHAASRLTGRRSPSQSPARTETCRMRRSSLIIPILLALFSLSFALFAKTDAFADGSTEPLTIVTAKGPVTFEVEVMRTDEDRAKGLMYRRYMPADRGMLFDFKSPGPVSM